MKIEKTGVVLEEKDVMDLEAIVLDADEKGALDFVKELKRRIEVQQHSLCGTPFGTTEK